MAGVMRLLGRNEEADEVERRLQAIREIIE